jgi:hypothetical protein
LTDNPDSLPISKKKQEELKAPRFVGHTVIAWIFRGFPTPSLARIAARRMATLGLGAS